jgi:hypothetical protein
MSLTLASIPLFGVLFHSEVNGLMPIRPAGDSEGALSDPGQAPYVRTFSQHIERNLHPRRIPARMFVVLGPLPLGLVAIGIYVVVSYAVASRTREIGLRLARPAEWVTLQIIRENLSVITCGVAIGWVLAFAISVHAITKGAIHPPLLLSVATLAAGFRRGELAESIR